MDSAERDLLIRTVAMEANKGDPKEQAAVAHVIMNRIGDPQYGKSMKDVIYQRGAFESWGHANLLDPKSKNKPQFYQPGVPAYDQAAKVVDGVLSGDIADPTNGADRFQEPKTVNARIAAGRVAKSEAAPKDAQRIGTQVFWSTSPLSQRKITNDAYADLYRSKQPSGQEASAGGDVPADTKIGPEAYADLFRSGGEREPGAEAAGTAKREPLAEIPQAAVPDAIPWGGQSVPVSPGVGEAYSWAGQHPVGAAALGASLPLAVGAGEMAPAIPAMASAAKPLLKYGAHWGLPTELVGRGGQDIKDLYNLIRSHF